jgi:toxin-antitoxin system PIN domain toxin
VKPALLEANLLIALLWPSHQHHERGHAWFERRRDQPWASCPPLTQLAFVRIVSNPAFSQEALSPAEALTLLGRNLSQKSHEFWPDDVGAVAALERSMSHIQGHRQLTDTYLLALAVRRKGTLATFDAGIQGLANRDLAKCPRGCAHGRAPALITGS